MNRLKQITTKAKALYKSGKYAKWTDAIKAASKQTATVGATKKKTAKKKAAPKKKVAVKKAETKKKATTRNYGSHKDTASHNVRISVVSGVNKDVNRSIEAYKRLQSELKEAEKNYNKAKDFTLRFYAKQKLDRIKYELRERKFVLTNLSKELKKVK
jgi:hypothetical protein